MSGLKRPHEDTGIASGDSIHPSRKRRVEYTEADAQLAKLYNDLADDVQDVRIKAAGELVRNLSATDPEQRVSRINTAVGRLIKGLCSGRKAARLGFSVALVVVLGLGFGIRDESFRLHGVLARVLELTTVHGNVSGQERRDHLLGRRFAYQAILQSEVVTNAGVSLIEWREFVEAVLEVMGEKQWLRRECGAMLFEYFENSKSTPPIEHLQVVVDGFQARSLWKTPEGVAIWMLFTRKFSQVKMPKNIWQHNDPLSTSERPLLSKVLQEVPTDDDQAQAGGKGAAGTRQAAPSFAWTAILKELCREERPPGDEYLVQFWKVIVDQSLFNASSSPERKALGLQVFSLAIPLFHPWQLQYLFTPNLMRCILNQRASSQSYLFDAAKLPLNQMIARARSDPDAVPGMVQGLIEGGAINFDQVTKSKTVENLLSHADADGLADLMSVSQMLMFQPQLGANEPGQADVQRRHVADLLLTMVRSKKEPGELFNKADGFLDSNGPRIWLSRAMEILLEIGFCKPQKELPITPPASESARLVCRQRLSSCLNHIMSLPLADAATTVYGVVKVLRSAKTAYYHKSASSEAKAIVKRTDKALRDLSESQRYARSKSQVNSASAFTLLYAMSVYQVYNDEPDAVSALEDLHNCAGDWGKNTESAAVLTELLLSFVSKQSALFRKLAEQVFSAFSASLTADGLQSMLDVLEQKESLSGQQELFGQGDDDEEEGEGGDKEGSLVDVDDMSDVELVNGEEVDAGSSDGSDGDDGEDDESVKGSEDEEDQEEIAAFNKKLADALGPAGVDADGNEEDDDSDMDDEQMMAIEPALQNVFKELKKKAGKKQESKDAKDNIVNFKNRVLDLLAMYVKAQHSSILALDIIMPLTILTRTTASKPTAEKAFAVLRQYFETCVRYKSYPTLSDTDVGFDLLKSLLSEMGKDGSKLHANACSRSSLFICRVILTIDPYHYIRIAELYAGLQSEWWCDPKSKVHGSVFTEWTSWSITTRASGLGRS